VQLVWLRRGRVGVAQQLRGFCFPLVFEPRALLVQQLRVIVQMLEKGFAARHVRRGANLRAQLVPKRQQDRIVAKLCADRIIALCAEFRCSCTALASTRRTQSSGALAQCCDLEPLRFECGEGLLKLGGALARCASATPLHGQLCVFFRARKSRSQVAFELHACSADLRLSRASVPPALPQALGAALAVLMAPIERADPVAFEADLMRRVAKSELDDFRKFLLFDIIETYSRLSAEERARFERLISRKEYRTVQKVKETWSDRMRAEGKRETLLRLLRAKFGPLAPETIMKIDAMGSLEELDTYLDRILTAESLEEMGL